MQPAPGADVASDERIEDERRAGNHERDQALGQRRGGDGGIRHQHPVALRRGRQRRPLREQERAQRQRETERQHGVERQHLGHAHMPDAARERECGVGARVATGQARGGEADGDDGEKARQRGRQARRPFVDAERIERGGAHPVLQRRLLEVLQVVQPRRHPVAARRHLAGDLAVAALVRMLEAPRVERGEPRDRRDEREQPPGAAGEGGEHRGSEASGGAARCFAAPAHSTATPALTLRGCASAPRSPRRGLAPCARRRFTHTIDRMMPVATGSLRCCRPASPRRRSRTRA